MAQLPPPRHSQKPRRHRRNHSASCAAALNPSWRSARAHPAVAAPPVPVPSSAPSAAPAPTAAPAPLARSPRPMLAPSAWLAARQRRAGSLAPPRAGLAGTRQAAMAAAAAAAAGTAGFGHPRRRWQ
eukprot:2086275-Pleurochrysis_carterae.AAC.1